MIQLKEITKSYKDGQNKKLVIDNLNLNICNIGLYTFLGPSGSGKTTILNLISLLDYPDSGDILINDKSILKFTQKEINEYRSNYIDYIFQDFNLFENESVLFNLSIITEDKNKIKEVLHIVSLDNYESRKVSSLSIGEKQRVAIARSIIKDSKILLCDEPTGNLDVENTKLVFELLKELSKTKLVILVTHDVENAKQYSDVIYKLKEGKVEEEIIHKVEEKEESNNSTNNKVRLGLSKIIKLGLSNIKKSLGTFIIAAIIVISQFAACISMIAVNSYDKSEAIAKTMKENLMYSSEVAISYDTKEKDIRRGEEYYVGPRISSVRETFLEELQNDCEDNTVATEYYFNVFFDFFSDKKDFEIKLRDYYEGYDMFYDDGIEFSLYTPYFSSIVVADTFDNFHQPLLSGRYPKAEGEIVLYDYIIDSLYHYEVIDTTDMVGKTLTYHFMDNEYKMTVVGILESSYKKFFDVYYKDNKKSVNMIWITSLFVDEYFSAIKNIFCLRNTFESLNKFYSEEYIQIKKFNLYCSKKEYKCPIYNYKYVRNVNEIRDKLIYFNEVQKADSPSIILSKKMVFDLFGVNSVEEFDNLDFNGEKGFEGFIKNSSVTYCNIDRYVSQWSGTQYYNSYLEISGIIESDNDYPYLLYDQEIKERYRPFGFRNPNIFLSNNWNKNKKLIKRFEYLEEKSDAFYDSVDSSWIEWKFCITNISVSIVDFSNYFLKTVREITNLISILLFFASFGILFYFSFFSISKNLYKIGLLSSLGCSKFKALSIYLVSFIFLFLISFLVAIPIAFIVISLVNGFYLENLTSIVYFFYISPLSLFISLMISLGVLLVGVVYPLIRLYRMPIIKTIKGYKNN